MLAWLPYGSVEEARRRLGPFPDGLEVRCYPFGGDAADVDDPETADRVGLLVLPYPVAMRGMTLIDRMPALEVVQTQLAGYEDVARALPAGVTLCNAAGVHDAGTAELAVALMLAVGRHLDEYARNHLDGRWAPHWGSALADKRVLIVGYGRIGAAVERRVAGFDVASITRVARTGRILPGLAAGGPADGERIVHGIDELDGLLPTADIVVLVTPLTPQTDRLLDARRLALLPDGATVINIGRGRLIDTDALTAETASGRIRAGLDVTDPEPLPADHPLWHHPGVLISPHMGGASTAFDPRIDALLGDQLHRWVGGEPLANVVVPGLIARSHPAHPEGAFDAR